MSASLVGSEMCIRDSQRAVRVHANGAPGARRVRSGCVPNAAHAQDTAVSYTHLTLPTICSV
eukprot:11516253-Alexandrium_andersonii.AAC.1